LNIIGEIALLFQIDMWSSVATMIRGRSVRSILTAEPQCCWSCPKRFQICSQKVKTSAD